MTMAAAVHAATDAWRRREIRWLWTLKVM